MIRVRHCLGDALTGIPRPEEGFGGVEPRGEPGWAEKALQGGHQVIEVESVAGSQW
jgi:hypothetical protein